MTQALNEMLKELQPRIPDKDDWQRDKKISVQEIILPERLVLLQRLQQSAVSYYREKEAKLTAEYGSNNDPSRARRQHDICAGDRQPAGQARALIGTAVHRQLARCRSGYEQNEMAVQVPVQVISDAGEEFTVNLSGVADSYNSLLGRITEYKVCSVSRYLSGNIADYQRQLQVYAWMLRQKGWRVQELCLELIFYDFDQRKVGSAGYPEEDIWIMVFKFSDAWLKDIGEAVRKRCLAIINGYHHASKMAPFKKAPSGRAPFNGAAAADISADLSADLTAAAIADINADLTAEPAAFVPEDLFCEAADPADRTWIAADQWHLLAPEAVLDRAAQKAEHNLLVTITLLGPYPQVRCTPEEMWLKPLGFRVEKEGRKKAVRVFKDCGQLLEWARQQKQDKDENIFAKYRVVLEPNEAVRCRSYCPVSSVCTQYRRCLLNPYSAYPDYLKVVSHLLRQARGITGYAPPAGAALDDSGQESPSGNAANQSGENCAGESGGDAADDIGG